MDIGAQGSIHVISCTTKLLTIFHTSAHFSQDQFKRDRVWFVRNTMNACQPIPTVIYNLIALSHFR